MKSPAESIEYLNLLIYGEFGAGKTWFGGTAQDHDDTAPLLVVDIEGGTTTLRHRQDVDVIQVRNKKQLDDTITALEKDTDRYYKTILVDSLTEMQKLDMAAVMKAAFNKNPEKTDIYVPDQRAWGKSGERVREVVRRFKDLPCHTIVTCLGAESKDEKTNVTTYYPSLPGKLRSEIPGFFDIVGWLRVETERGEGNEERLVRYLQTTKTNKVNAKDRTGALPPVIKDPTIPMLWDLIHNEQKENGK